MGRKRRDEDESTRINNYEDMTTLTLSKENRDKISVIVDWMERTYYKKEGRRMGYVLNDGIDYLLRDINLEEFL